MSISDIPPPTPPLGCTSSSFCSREARLAKSCIKNKQDRATQKFLTQQAGQEQSSGSDFNSTLWAEQHLIWTTTVQLLGPRGEVLQPCTPELQASSPAFRDPQL